MWIFQKNVNPSEFSQAIIGTWKCIDCANPQVYKTYKIFKDDNTHTQISKNYKYKEEDFVSTGTWTIEGDKLIIGWRLDQDAYYGVHNR